MTGKAVQVLKTGPIFEVSASTRANAQPVIKQVLMARGYKDFSIVPAAADNSYMVYVTG